MPRIEIKPEYRRYNRINIDDARIGPDWQPTETQSRMAQELAGYGLPRTQIATLFGISESSLTRYLGDVMDLGLAQVNALYLRTFFYKITVEKNDNLLKFYLARRLGWVEPKAEEPNVVDDTSRELSDEELNAELRALAARERTATTARGLAPPVQE